MNPYFVEDYLSGSIWLRSRTLDAKGVRNGFLGKPLDFIKQQREASSQILREALRISEIAILNQVHGDEIVPGLPPSLGPEPFAEADGVVFPLITPGRTVAVGVRTADCVPLVMAGSRYGAVVHAGWRGLAQGIVQKSVRMLRSLDGDSVITATIGPCAGTALYEVGPEVLAAIGRHAVASPKGEEKFLLDLTGTASLQLTESGVNEIHPAGVCTISDSRFHSFRRDRDKTGNNFAFLLTSPA